MSNWSLNKKIWAVLGLLTVAFIGSVYIALTRMSDIRASLEEITKVIVKRDQMTSGIQDNQRVLTIYTREIILESDETKMQALKKSFDEGLEKQAKDIQAYNEIAAEEGKALIKKYQEGLANWVVEVRKAQKLTMEKHDKEAWETLVNASSILKEMRARIDDVNDLTAKTLSAKSQEADSTARSAVFLSLIFSSVSIILSLSIAFFVLRAVTRAIGEVVKNLSDSSVQVSGAATQIASSSEELSQAATEQAASLEETAASVEEMNSMISKNSENARSAEETSGKSQEAVTTGKDIIKKMMESMEAINLSSEGMAETVKVIEQIDKKTKVINEIVNKTELLSFNASVEAARAGEHGKGFAVVAEEVGNLARMSGAAAEEIASLLEESIQKVNQMVATTKKNVESGTQITKECGDVFEDVVQNVGRVSGMATEISSASQEQSRGIGEITKAMSQLDQMTQQNAATSEECASAAEELSAQAEALKNAVSHLVVTINGNDGSGPAFSTTAAPASQPKKPAAKPAGASHNVVQLKGPRPAAPAKSAPALKKASGDAPAYDSDGFTDV